MTLKGRNKVEQRIDTQLSLPPALPPKHYFSRYKVPMSGSKLIILCCMGLFHELFQAFGRFLIPWVAEVK